MVNTLILIFNLMKVFKQNYKIQQVRPARFRAFTALFVFLAFALLDVYLMQSMQNDLIKTRLVFVIVMATILSLSYLKFIHKFWQTLIVIDVFIASIAIMVLSGDYGESLKMLIMQGSYLLLLFYCYGLSKLLFLPAAFAGLGVTTLYAINYINDADTSKQLFNISLVFLIIANIIGRIYSYLRQKKLFHE